MIHPTLYVKSVLPWSHANIINTNTPGSLVTFELINAFPFLTMFGYKVALYRASY